MLFAPSIQESEKKSISSVSTMRLDHGCTSKETTVARKASSGTQINGKDNTRPDDWTQVAAYWGCDTTKGVYARDFVNGRKTAAAEEVNANFLFPVSRGVKPRAPAFPLMLASHY
jgi:hypothetical protein